MSSAPGFYFLRGLRAAALAAAAFCLLVQSARCAANSRGTVIA